MTLTERYLMGASVRDLALEEGVSRSTICRRLAKAGCPTRKSGWKVSEPRRKIDALGEEIYSDLAQKGPMTAGQLVEWLGEPRGNVLNSLRWLIAAERIVLAVKT